MCLRGLSVLQSHVYNSYDIIAAHQIGLTTDLLIWNYLLRVVLPLKLPTIQMVWQSFLILGYTIFSKPRYLKMIMSSDLMNIALLHMKLFYLFQEMWPWDHDVNIVSWINENYSRASWKLNLVDASFQDMELIYFFKW